MTTAKDPKNRKVSQTDWQRVQRQEAGLEPIDFSEIPEQDAAWFENAEIRYPDDIAVKLHVDREVLEWFKSHFPKHRTRMNQILKSFKEKPWTLLANAEISEPVLLTANFNRDMINWFKIKEPDYEMVMNQVLRDFMEWCIEKGEPK